MHFSPSLIWEDLKVLSERLSRVSTSFNLVPQKYASQMFDLPLDNASLESS